MNLQQMNGNYKHKNRIYNKNNKVLKREDHKLIECLMN